MNVFQQKNKTASCYFIINVVKELRSCVRICLINTNRKAIQTGKASL